VEKSVKNLREGNDNFKEAMAKKFLKKRVRKSQQSYGRGEGGGGLGSFPRHRQEEHCGAKNLSAWAA